MLEFKMIFRETLVEFSRISKFDNTILSSSVPLRSWLLC